MRQIIRQWTTVAVIALDLLFSVVQNQTRSYPRCFPSDSPQPVWFWFGEGWSARLESGMILAR
jgi:hypothetical protein